MSGIHRDAGLVRGIGQWGLAANLVSTIVGAGIFAVPGALAACVGPWAPLAFVVCGIAIASVAVCLAEGGSRLPTSGGIYGYIDAAFGPCAGYISGTLLWLSDVLACGGIAAALADASVSLLPASLKTAAHAAVIVVVIAAIAALNIGGVKRGARLVNLATIVKLIPLAVFLIAGAWAVHSANFAPQPMQPARDGLGRALILALFTLTGMEGSLSASGEVANPSRSIPRALAIAIGSAVVLYIAIQITAQGILGPALAHSTVPLADAMARISPALGALMLAGAAISMLGWITGDILATPRMFFAFGRDGLYPRILGRTHPRTHAPHIAILCYASIAAILALTGTFAELAVLATLASAVLYIGGCLAAWRLARNGVARAGTPLSFRWLPAAMVVGIASMIALIALASRAEIIGLVAVTSAAAVLYLAQTRLRPAKNSAETPAL